MGARPRPMEHIRVYLRHNNSALHLLHSLYLHPHQACLRGRHLLRLDMAVLKAFCHQVSIRLSSKASPLLVLRHLLVLALHRDLDNLLAKVLHPEYPLVFNRQDLEELGNREVSEAQFSSITLRKASTRGGMTSCPHKSQNDQNLVLLAN